MTNEEMNAKKQKLASKGRYDINDLLMIMKLLRARAAVPGTEYRLINRSGTICSKKHTKRQTR